MAERCPARRASGGFTLLELLIVLVIFGLIMTALTAGLRFGSRAWQAQERRADRQDDLDALQGFLRQLIASGQGFSGDAASLKFVGTLPRALALPGRFDIELAESADRLVLRWRSHVKPLSDPSKVGEGDATETELAKGIADLALAYYVVAPGQAPTWLASLTDRNQPPKLISIMLHPSAPDGRRWPPLIVAPMIDVPPGQK